MPEIRLEKVIETSTDIEKLEALYESAFPAEERPMPMRDFIAMSGRSGFLNVEEFLADGEFCGFTVYAETEKWTYGLLLAIRDADRSKGYGTLALKALMDSKKDKIHMGVIEKPVKSAPNYEQRIRRQVFYERLGMYISDITIKDGDSEYLLIASKKDEDLESYFHEYMERVTALQQEQQGREA